MNERKAQDLAAFVSRESGQDAYVTANPLERGYMVAVEGEHELILLRSWVDWHTRKDEVLRLRSAAA